MKGLVIFVLCVAAVSSFKLSKPQRVGRDIVVPTLGTSNRIIGGTAIPITDAPWQVALVAEVYSLRQFFCGGSLISSTWVVTAAHCLEGIDTAWIRVNLGNTTTSGVVVRTVVSAIIHSSWNSETVQNDIALLQIAAVPLSDSISPVQLANSSYVVNTGTVLTATGWGRTSDDPAVVPPEYLQSANMSSITNSLCAQTFGSIIQPSHLCVSTLAGTATCNGDSGGPLVDGDVLVGLTSFGAAGGCAAGYPAVFTRISYFYNWIISNTGM